MEDSNKKRSANFTSKEEHILISLVLKFKEQIECRSDTNTNKLKLNAWKRVTNEFNSISGENYRQLQVLKNKYENIKKRSKQKFAAEKSFLKKTGGGPPEDFHVDDIDNAIKQIIGTQMTGLQSEFDDDRDGSVVEVMDEEMDISDLRKQLNNDSKIVECSNTIETNGLQILPSLDCQGASSSYDLSNEKTALLDHSYITSNKETAKAIIHEDWSKCTPGMLKKKISSPLIIGDRNLSSINKGNNCLKRNRNPLNSRLVEWSSTKIELAEIQKTAFYEEHRLKLKHMQEKHDKWMLLQETESAMKMKFLKEEHDMNMSLLQEKKRLLDK
ncbi:uncharacterized protein [Leptinotarsa decemlineata]|uniref:uncharacterized protein n=1 Tax=Leptinotarsa decemlineata TaxID=7539 RepID=UPI003D30BEB8